MKTVILFRHGKSDWDADYEIDHDRPLAKRGIKAAKKMGKWLGKTDQAPDMSFVSTALRTRQTYELASLSGEWNSVLRMTNELYDSDVDSYLRVMRSASDEISRILVVGHEPTCSMTTSYLIGGGVIRFPTATMARVDLSSNTWNDLGRQTGTLIWLKPPRINSDL